MSVVKFETTQYKITLVTGKLHEKFSHQFNLSVFRSP